MSNFSPLERSLISKLDAEPSVRFAFRKRDGSIRDARGTRNLLFIPLRDHPKQIHPLSGTSVKYYDWDKGEWRSWTVGSIMQVFD